MNQTLVMGVGIGLVAAAEILGAGWILWKVFHCPHGDLSRPAEPIRVASSPVGDGSHQERMQQNIYRWSEWLFRDEDRSRDIPQLLRWGVTDRDEQEAVLAGVNAMRQRIRVTDSIQWAQQMRERKWLRQVWGPPPVMPLDAEGMREKRQEVALRRQIRWAEWREKNLQEPGSGAAAGSSETGSDA